MYFKFIKLTPSSSNHWKRILLSVFLVSILASSSVSSQKNLYSSPLEFTLSAYTLQLEQGTGDSDEDRDADGGLGNINGVKGDGATEGDEQDTDTSDEDSDILGDEEKNIGIKGDSILYTFIYLLPLGHYCY